MAEHSARLTATSGASRHDRRVGLDRASVMPALLVLTLAVLMSVVLPLINRGASYQHPIQRGDTVALADGITLVPTAGWDLVTGALVGHARSPVGTTATTELIDSGVDVDVQAAPFAGTPAALLRRVRTISAKLNHARGAGTATRSYPVTTWRGVRGAGQDFTGISREGSVIAFVFRSRGQSTGEGVEVVVSGPKGAISRRRDDVVAMIRSIRTAS